MRPWKPGQGHPWVGKSVFFTRCIYGMNIKAIDIFLAKILSLPCFTINNPVTLKTRSRSSMSEHNERFLVWIWKPYFYFFLRYWTSKGFAKGSMPDRSRQQWQWQHTHSINSHCLPCESKTTGHHTCILMGQHNGLQ